MREILNTFKSLLGKSQSNHREPRKLQFIRKRKDIRSALWNSKTNQTVIGIYSNVLGEGLFLCGVEDQFTMDGEEVVILKPYDMYGILLQRNTVSLSEIRAVCVMDYAYQNPLIAEVSFS